MSDSGDIDPLTALAIAWLEDYQLGEYRKLGIEPSIQHSMDGDAFENAVAGVSGSLAVLPNELRREIEKLHGFGTSVPGSRYDKPVLRGQLSQIGAELERFIDKPPTPRPIFGVL